jgi:fatty-acyl-CoA synthase
MADILWPAYDEPGDLARIEAVPLAERGLPGTTYDLVVRAAELWPHRVAVSVLPDAARYKQPVRRTFAELRSDVHAYANVLHELGVRRGDAVALMSPNCDDLVTATLAAELAGVAAPVNASLSVDTVTELLARSGARVLITAGPELSSDAWQTALKLAEAGRVEALLVLEPTAARSSARVSLPSVQGVHVARLGEEASRQPHQGFLGEPPSAGDVAALFHTGGTTGTPKLAAHTHANEVSDAWMIAATGTLREDSVLFAALPLFHVNALLVTVLAPLFKGLHVVWAGPLGYRDQALFANFWKLVEHHGVSLMSAVPTVYAALADVPVDADISSLRHGVVGASPLPRTVRHSFQSATGVQLVEGYGLTEATCASALSFPGHPRPGSVGQRLPYQRMKVVRVTNEGAWQDVEPGQLGLLAISGPTVFAGYVTGHGPGGPTLSGLGKLRDGWLDTGDLAWVDADGFVHLGGRAKDLIIRGGHNIDPAAIEHALLAHPAVTAAQAVGRPDAHAGEVPVAFVTLTPGAAVTTDDLCRWAADRVPEHAAAPKSVTVLEAIPVTSVGKPFKPPLRAEAARQAVAEALRGTAGVTAVRGDVVDGAAVVVVAVSDDVDEVQLKQALDRFAITWRLEKS